MTRTLWSRVFAVTAVLVAVGACKSGPPAIHDVKLGKDKEATQAASTFDARDTVYAVGNIDNPPSNGKVVGRLAIVDVEGQKAGPIPGLESTLSLSGGLNKVNFDFTPPTAGWPNGKYQLQMLLLDESGAQKDQKNADFTTAGNQPPAASAPSAATDSATDSAATDTTATQQQ